MSLRQGLGLRITLSPPTAIGELFQLQPRLRDAPEGLFQHLVGAQDTTNTLWQVTIERSAPEKAEQFLHVIHVGDAEGYHTPKVRKVAGNGTVGAEVEADGRTYTVTFRTTGPVGGHVTVQLDGRTLIDKDLTKEVQPQKGYAEVR